MTSRLISQTSALILLLGGGALLFAPAELLSALSPGFPASAAWVGQLLGAAWLGLAALNWLSRSAVLGGIYGRPVVFANLMLYFVGGLSVLRAAERAEFPPLLWAVIVPAAILAAAYGGLLLRGPLPKDSQLNTGK